MLESRQAIAVDVDAEVDAQGGPLHGLTVLDLSTTLAGGWVGQFLADAGADVLHVEPPGGSPLRALAAWPALARGQSSLVLDLRDPADQAALGERLRAADVLITTMRPETTARLGLDAASLATLNPRLVSVAITGFGTAGPWAHIPGYEALVLAKLGILHTKRRMQPRPGPVHVTVPYASWGAAQSALHGVLAALLEREDSGLGQHVDADLTRGALCLDTWDWFLKIVSHRWPDAYHAVDAFDQDGEPASHLVYPLLVAPTSDGHWLQFAQVQPRLFQAMLQEFGLLPLLADPKWAGFPFLEDQALRTELWEHMIEVVGQRTLAEWEDRFEACPDLNAEVFRSGPGVFQHPQLIHDGRVVVATDPDRGPVLQPSTLVHVDEQPLRAPRPAPPLGAHPTADLTHPAVAPGPPTPGPAGPPLAGLTVLDFGIMFAAPFATSLLADLGATVIKIESLEGDSIRNIAGFPEAGGCRVMQGKQSIAVDLTTVEGRAVVHELATHADVVLQGFRAGAAERAGIDATTLRALNPALVYVNAPGYGTSGPSGTKPAYAPTMGAAAGLALADAPDAEEATASVAEVKRAALRLFSASAVVAVQADGISAVAVASALLLGVLARRRGKALGPLTTTMFANSTHAMLDHVVDWAGRPPSDQVDTGGYGLSALYRLYPAQEGWVYLAAPGAKDWTLLVETLSDVVDLTDARFGSAADRAHHDSALADLLAAAFVSKPATVWEELCLARGLGCVAVCETDPATNILNDEALLAEYTVPATNHIFEDHDRIGPHVRFSRSTTRPLGGCSAGEHTDAILRGLGHDDAAIAALHEHKVVA